MHWALAQGWGYIRATLTAVLQKSAPGCGGTGLGLSRAGALAHSAVKPEHGSTLTKVERNA